MRQLYQARTLKLINSNKHDIKQWADIYKVIAHSTTLVDRCEIIIQPFNFTLFKPLKIPKLPNDFSVSYDECCRRRALELKDLSARLDKPLVVMYSGGIDSTLVLVSLLREDCHDQIKVAMTIDSIHENPAFFNKFLRGKVNIINSEHLGDYFDGKSIIVSGDLNDQLLGSDLLGSMFREKGDFTDITTSYSRKRVTEFYVSKGMQIESANKWFDILDYHARMNAPCKIETMFDFFWWYNFCFKWQGVHLRMLTCSYKKHRHRIDKAYVENYLQIFYNTEYFQQWSMANNHMKIRDSWKSYKHVSKQVIYDYNKDLDYFENKVKVGSLYTVFRQRDRADAITSDFELIQEEEFNPEEFYIKDHHFL